jgi:hypothetical protein
MGVNTKLKKQNMKNFTLITLFTLATCFAVGQSRQDQAQVLQHCIDLPGLQKYYPMNDEGKPKQICILQHGVSFPPDIEVSKFGKSVLLCDKSQIAALGINSYFLFWEFKIDQNSAKVDFVYNYIDSGTLPKMQKMTVELQKSNDSWAIVNANMEER